MLLPVKSPSPVVLSHQNEPIDLFRTVFACLISAYFSPDSDKTTFSLEKSKLWTRNLFGCSGLKLKSLNDRFVPYKHSCFALNWWNGVVWITYELLWCFYQLFGLSFWRHPFTAEDPLVSKWCNAEFIVAAVTLFLNLFISIWALCCKSYYRLITLLFFIIMASFAKH